MTDPDKQECHEGVERQGFFEPCDRPAVGYRLDPSDGRPYPVCKRHLVAPVFVPSYDLVLDDFNERDNVTPPNTERAERG